MTRSWLLAAVLALLLLAAWLLSSPGRSARTPHSTLPRDAAARSADPAFADLGGAENRLRGGLANAPRPALQRNLFAFHETPPAAAIATHAAAVPASAVSPSPRPPMRLVGVARDDQDGQTSRVALVSVFGQLYFLKEGERLLARYVVVRIGEDAVQLKDGDESFTLALK